ncbi:ABC transporter substrate-binding protein [Cereibacter azotoformans]|uniref:Taurine transport system substrate-binding protein n=1 Tax=Cereibacter azotoformans TaxID=43057 RepID=A0A2T5JT49_9RHOB|nr:ABC transporter substrate-binding protein [Cereibacter azotoformans]AXQ95722.1 taurine ABC transporter substrate-binding protein [Cereibacter sphaeroides]PTR12982.1 taurine transport system substrate-binding protein [Cereibacter azotoformans]UIJ32778.1 ABC transporter substrate-binding protein [Cereibacter azotoformans]
MKIRSVLAGAVSALGLFAAQAQAEAPSEITVAYFLEWPLPFEAAKSLGTFEKELGVKINWRAFDTGTAMSAAFASGDVQYAISQGVPPFVTAVSAGQDLIVIDAAVGYAENDNCVVRTDLEITRDNAKDLEGKKVGLPIGTAPHFGFLKVAEHLGIDVSKVQVVDIAPADAAAAFAAGNFDAVCGWGGPLRRMKEHGNVLLTGAEKEAIGIKIFDVVSTTAVFANEQPELTSRFLKVINDANDAWKADPESLLPVIAKDSGLDEQAAKDNLATFTLLPIDEKLGPDWLGGGVQTYLKEVADFFVSTGNIPQALPSYDAVVKPEFLAAAAKG